MTWYEDLYGGVDAMDSSAVARLCTPDTELRVANHPPTRGREAVVTALVQLWGSIGGLQHRFVNVIEDGDRAVVEAVVDYTRRDGSHVSIPVATMIERRDGLIVSQRIYMDAEPLFGSAPS